MSKLMMNVQTENFAKRDKALSCMINPDGTFRLDDVSEGDWQLTVTIDSFSSGGYEQGGKLEHTFTIAAVPGGVSDEPLDLGMLEIKKPAQENPGMAGLAVPIVEVRE
jgi:hypothetical protein